MGRARTASASRRRTGRVGRRRRKIQRVVEMAGEKGLSRLAVHLVERATIAKMKGETAEHWTERQFHKQYDQEGRERVEGVIDEIHTAGLWPWG